MTSIDDTTETGPDHEAGDAVGASIPGAPNRSDHERPASGLSYGQALEELESLLAELEGADVDVDRLARKVARGVELVRFCRQRLSEVTADVDQVVADLVDPSPDDGSPDGGRGGDPDD